MSPTTVRRKPRQSRACARCQARKIKCDFQVRCGPCARADAQCVAFDSRRGVDQPRSLVAHLEAELARLQAEASNIPVHASGDHAAHVASTTVRSKAARLAATAMAPHRDAFKQTNLLPLTARSFLTSSPVPYHVAQASPSVAEPVPSAPSLPRATPISQVPRHVVDVMLKHYCGNYRPQYPTIDEVDLYKACDRVYNDLQPSDFDIFCVAITLAISINTLMFQDETKAMTAVSEFYATAMAHLDRIGSESPWDRLQALQLLTHYAFLNPQTVDCRTCAAASSRLCFQLGLHHELDLIEQAKLDTATLDTRRRMFWNSYSIDSAVHTIRCYPFEYAMSSFTTRRPDSIPELSQSAHVWSLRAIEVQITMALYYPSIENEYSARYPRSDEWIADLNSRLHDWHQTVRQSVSLSEKIEFYEIFYQFQLLRLNRPSPRFPRPSSEMQKRALHSAVALIREFTMVDRLVKLFYLWHAAHTLAESGVCLLALVLVGMNPERGVQSLLDGEDCAILRKYIFAFPRLLVKIARRWTPIAEYAATLETLSVEVLALFNQWETGDRSELPSQDGLKHKLADMSLFSPFPAPARTAEHSLGCNQPDSPEDDSAYRLASMLQDFSNDTWGMDQPEVLQPMSTRAGVEYINTSNQVAEQERPTDTNLRNVADMDKPLPSPMPGQSILYGLSGDTSNDMVTWDFTGFDPDDIFAALLGNGQSMELDFPSTG